MPTVPVPPLQLLLRPPQEYFVSAVSAFNAIYTIAVIFASCVAGESHENSPKAGGASPRESASGCSASTDTIETDSEAAGGGPSSGGASENGGQGGGAPGHGDENAMRGQGHGMGAQDAAPIYEVGPGKPFDTLSGVAPLLQPGDLVLVHGDHTYSDVVFENSGTDEAKITIFGIRVNGRRPHLEGGETTLAIRASHYVVEGFDVAGGSSHCVYSHGDGNTVRDSVIHDCPSACIFADRDSEAL